ncbi:CwfJ C-terminus 1-domain-containing protein-like protein [Ephemerocybe angulata]|uniref:CwfJ C-terminus 1-domain-containing protein-like protein n=1 Tax=Ephemerocybe angulata TaxID=980116 RepID=A0A8H6I435_9AGAR|nr:CwfJ C-terminus 1-domain-containing protein-like protein [Tulosesus angulatus]
MGDEVSTKQRSSSTRKREYSKERSSKHDHEIAHDHDHDHPKKRRKHDRGETGEERNKEEKKRHHKHKSKRKDDSDDEGKDTHRSKKHKEHRDRGSDDEGRHRKHKHKKGKDGDREKGKGSSRAKESSHIGMQIVDDDPDDRVWAEKDITMEGERVLATDIPTAESLKITSTAEDKPGALPLPKGIHSETTLKRDEWMLAPAAKSTAPLDDLDRRTREQLLLTEQSLTEDYGEPSGGSRNAAGNVDFFSSLGTERVKKNPKVDRPNPDNGPVIHRLELNQDLKEGKPMNFKDAPPPPKATPGGPGSSWRMMRLRKVYEAAEEEGRSVEEIGIDRFGTLDAFEAAQEERRILDERQGKKADRERDRGRQPEWEHTQGGAKGFMFNDFGDSAGSSRSSSFKRPGGNNNFAQSGPSTPSPQSGSARAPANKRPILPLAQSHTPIPSVMTPSSSVTMSGGPVLSTSELNKLQAKKLEKEYEAQSRRAQGVDTISGVRTKVEVLPTLDAQGRLYDVGRGGKDDEEAMPGNRRKKEPKFETHDRKTGEVIRINANDDDMTLGEMLRQERFGAGMQDQKNLDAEFARQIMGDGKFQSNLEYLDENAEKLGRQKMRTDGMKRQFAINDYKRTQKVLASCQFCYGEDDSPPKAPVIAMGTRTYLSCTLTEELVPGHCLIVPIQHHLTMLEGDDDVWDEIKNFMKCLMKMFSEEDKGVIFYETVISLKWQKHTVIECLPLPWEIYDLIPGYFKESILASEAEWSQHKKLIDFSARPGGFRRAMVPNLPYFMVQFDYKGEKGYGHVIEGTADAGEHEDGLEEGEKGGGEFPSYFAGEIIGSVLELEARRWRRPKRVSPASNKDRVEGFQAKYKAFDWTGMLGRP